MLYLIMPDRFANGNQKTIAMLLQRKYNRDLPGGRRRRHSRDNKNLDYISSLGATAIWTRYVKIMTNLLLSMLSDVYKIDPVTEQMLITCVWPLRCIKRHVVMDYVVNHWGRTLDDERFTNTRLDSSI
jgi:hypothetical protein